MSQLVNGIQLCARFAYKPHYLGYCGPNEYQKMLYHCIIHGDCQNFRHTIQKFTTLYSYLSLLSKRFSRNMFDKEIVESYWIGNELTKSFTEKDFDIWLKIYTNIIKKPQINDILSKSFRKYSLPFFPTHSFHVLFSFLLSSSKVEAALKRVNNCLIRSGEVIRFNKKEVILRSWKLEAQKKFLKIVQCREKVHYQKEFFPSISKGDRISFHWGEGCIHITNTQQNLLQNYVETLLSCL